MVTRNIFSLFLAALCLLPGASASDALVKAVESGSVEAVISLLKGGDRPDYVFGRASWTPLIVAADRKHVDIIEALLEHGADPNLAEGDGWTPIMFSIIKNDMPSVRALLRAGARLDHVSKNEWTPLKAAQRAGTAMVDFVKQETVRSKELSVDNVAHNKAFLGAVREGDIEQVRDMLNRGMNPNVLSSNGWNAATYAASSGNAKLLILLVRRGVQVNKPDKDGWTPIMFAAFQGRPEIVKLLLEHGADPFVENVFKTSAFTMAGENAKNKKDLTSIKLITDFGLERSLSDDLENTMMYVRAPLANVNYQRKSGGRWTPLILATSRGNVDYVRELLGIGANPNIAELDGWTPLHFAVHGNKLDIVRLLMEASADPNIKNVKSQSALDFASNTKDPVLYNKILLKIHDAPVVKGSDADPAKIVLPAFTESAPDTPASVTPPPPPPEVPKAAAKLPPKTTSTKTPSKTSPQSTSKGAASSKFQPPPLREGPRKKSSHRDNAYDDQPFFDFIEEEPIVEEAKSEGLLGKIKSFFGI